MLVEQIINKVNQDFAVVGMPALERKGANLFFINLRKVELAIGESKPLTWSWIALHI